MSHFNVLVVGSQPEDQLAPFHEFECTDRNDKYVQEVDITEKVRKEYEDQTEERLQDPEGNLHSFFDEKGDWRPEFSVVDEDDKPFFKGAKKRLKKFVPEGYTKVEVPTSQIMSFLDYVLDMYEKPILAFEQEPDTNNVHRYGWVSVDEKGLVLKVVDRTNPNAKWDWYKLGGRWTGFFKLKSTADISVVGRPGLMTKLAKPGYADMALKSDIDFKSMRTEAAKEAGKKWDKIHQVIDPHISNFMSWNVVLAKHDEENVKEAREEFHAQPLMKALQDNKLFLWDGVEPFLVKREDYAQEAYDTAIETFAVIKDGQWYQKGRMGWWACVSDEMDPEEWSKQFKELLDSLPETEIISVYDCHI